MTLKGAMRSLTQDLIQSQEARTSEVNSIKQSTRAHLQEMDRAQEAMAHQQRETLAKGRTQLTQEVQAWISDVFQARQAMAHQQRETLARGRAQVAQEVQTWISDVFQARQAMAHQQQETLAKGRTQLAQEEGHRKAEVQAWMNGIAEDHSGARDEWLKMTKITSDRRAGTNGNHSPLGAGAPGFAELGARVSDYLTSHSGGTKLTQIEEAFRLNRFQAVQVTKRLMSEGRAEKRDLLYFSS